MAGLTVQRERMWAQWKRKDNVLVRLPADPDSYQTYLRKGLIFIRYGKESEIPLALAPQVTKEELKSIAPEPKVEAVRPVVEDEERELYVSDKPPKPKKKRR